MSDAKYRLKARVIADGFRWIWAEDGTQHILREDERYRLQDTIRDALAEAARKGMGRAVDKWDIMIESMRALAESDNFRGTDFARILLSYVKDAEAIRKELAE